MDFTRPERSHQERTGREDRHSKLLREPGNLPMWAELVSAQTMSSVRRRWVSSEPRPFRRVGRVVEACASLLKGTLGVAFAWLEALTARGGCSGRLHSSSDQDSGGASGLAA